MRVRTSGAAPPADGRASGRPADTFPVADHLLCACGKDMPEPLQRVGDRRALCGCGQPTRLDDRAQAAYAERAERPEHNRSPEPPRAAAPDPEGGPERDPAPAGDSSTAAPGGRPSSWSEAEISAEAQLPEVPEEEAEPETVPTPRVGDLGSWLSG